MAGPGSVSLSRCGRLLTREATVRFLRYAGVGVISNVAGYLLYLLITWLGLGPKTAMTTLYGAGAAIGFIGNRQWAFKHRGSVLQSALRYGAAHLCGYGLNLCMLFYLTDRLGYPHQLVQALAVVVVAIFLFMALNLFVFPRSSHTGGKT